MTLSVRRLLLTLVAIVPMAACASTAAAQADASDVSGACRSGALSQPFAPWGDNATYELAPAGDFESGGWSLTGSAQIVSGSEPFAATGTLGASALSVPAGSSATSPLTCLDASYPSMRMFVGGSGVALVSVVYRGTPIPVGAIHGGDSWSPSAVLNTGGALFGLLSGGDAQVSLRITGLTGNPVVDDVFIDPWQRCC
ncbi:MAG TPA: hypothetical protein VFN55_05505 [Solirubrobacteraceae bacterium]|nr:hypothetical protein [Solirubrobacteraceae bacterium]